MSAGLRFDWERALLASDLDLTAKAVGLVIATHYNDRDGYARPGQATIAAEASLSSTATVRKALRRLSDAGLIAWTKVPGGANASRYRLLIPGGETAPTGTVPTRETAPQGARDRSPGNAEHRGTRSGAGPSASARAGKRVLDRPDHDRACSSKDAALGVHFKLSGSGGGLVCSWCGTPIEWRDDAWRSVA